MRTFLTLRWSEGRPRSRRWSIALRFGGFIAALALAGCQPNVLDPQGVVGRGDATILLNSVAIMLAIVVPTDRRHARLRLVVPRLQHKSNPPPRF